MKLTEVRQLDWLLGRVVTGVKGLALDSRDVTLYILDEWAQCFLIGRGEIRDSSIYISHIQGSLGSILMEPIVEASLTLPIVRGYEHSATFTIKTPHGELSISWGEAERVDYCIGRIPKYPDGNDVTPGDRVCLLTEKSVRAARVTNRGEVEEYGPVVGVVDVPRFGVVSSVSYLDGGMVTIQHDDQRLPSKYLCGVLDRLSRVA